MSERVITTESKVLLAKVFICFFMACFIITVGIVLGNKFASDDSVSGWALDAPFLGFSVSVICCLAVLLLLSIRSLLLMWGTVSGKRSKNFSAAVLWLSLAIAKLLWTTKLMIMGDRLSLSGEYAKPELRKSDNPEKEVGSVPWLLDVEESIRIHRILFRQLVLS